MVVWCNWLDTPRLERGALKKGIRVRVPSRLPIYRPMIEIRTYIMALVSLCFEVYFANGGCLLELQNILPRIDYLGSIKAISEQTLFFNFTATSSNGRKLPSQGWRCGFDSHRGYQFEAATILVVGRRTCEGESSVN